MRKIELLSPAGDLEKLKIAILYGANAVFIGGKRFSLRSMASNFEIEDIKKGCEFAHAHNAKIHVTCNIVMHEGDSEGILDYLHQLEEAGVDAIIASSPAIISMVKNKTKMQAHLSTQQSCLNHEAVEAFASLGADRIVLGRECSIEEIKKICQTSPVEIETFIHGAMCSSISGRCVLSNVMSQRDANRGGCAQSCRWDYELYQNGKSVAPDKERFTMSGKDLMGMDYLGQLIEAGVASLKIEGRMKSLHYIATVTNAYRKAIDEYYQYGKIIHLKEYKQEVLKAENRPTSIGFFQGDVRLTEQLYGQDYTTPTVDFHGLIRGYEKEKKLVRLEVRNKIIAGNEYELFSPTFGAKKITLNHLYNAQGKEIEIARTPMEVIYFPYEESLEEYVILR